MSDSHATTAAPATHDHGHDDHYWEHHIKTYKKIGLILFICTGFTVFAAYHIDLHDRAMNITFGLMIAAFKSSLVALIFMHLKNEKTIIYKFLIFTTIFFGVMLFLILSTQSDPIPADPTHNMVERTKTHH